LNVKGESLGAWAAKTPALNIRHANNRVDIRLNFISTLSLAGGGPCRTAIETFE